MKLSLYQRLSLSLLLVFILIITVFYFWSQNLEKRTRYESEQNLHLSLAANLARDNPLLQQGVYDYDALKNLFHTLMVLGPAFEFYFLDPTGKLLTHSIAPSLIKRNKIDLVPLIQLTHNQAALPIYGDDPRHTSRKKIFSAAPVFNGQTLKGYLYVIVTGEQYESEFNRLQSSKQTELSIALVVIAILLLFIVMLGLFRYFTHPLRLLIANILSVKEHGFQNNEVVLHKWKLNSQNEVHQLGCVFQEMLQQINLQFECLQKIDTHRRELLADISHDLRTPLASLQGYIETISLKGESLTTQQRTTYINTALKNSFQLKTLIDQIFELAHLENGQVSLNLETFNLLELLYDVSAKFTLAANKKNIQIQIKSSQNNIQVHSDIGKLDRILSNLLENAIRHTQQSGEIILQVIDNESSHCEVSVIDNGSGIKQEEVPYIFDARYRASNATHSGGVHTGLGLAITKKLLEILHSDIKVNSTIGKGTRFMFNLRKVS